jgi:hypothetical protein
MPPPDEDMFTGYEDFEPEDFDEDEGAHGDEDGGSSHHSSPTPSADF